MAKIVTIHAAKTTLSQLIARVEAGEEIIIARDKSPVARLVPIGRAKAKRQFGAMRGKARGGAGLCEPLPQDDLRGWCKAIALLPATTPHPSDLPCDPPP